MLGSIYIGLSGLNAYSEGLKTVSNNVSNLNSTGFKSTAVSFANVYASGSTGGLDLATSRAQSGQGVQLKNGSISFDQGELRDTGRDLDLAIDGGGFFVLLDGNQTAYTRTGSFAADNDGYIVLAGTDYQLGVLDSAGRPTSLNIDTSRTSAPAETTKVQLGDNLSSTATEYTLPDLKIYDERGREHLWTLNFTREEAIFDEWTLKITNGDGEEIGSKTLKFISGIADPSTQTLTFEDNSSGLSVELDFSKVTSFSSGSVSSTRAINIDGNATGTITAIKVNENGQLEATYSNEKTVQLGSIALADFRDPQKLEQRSGGLFVQNGYTQIQYLTAKDSRVGSILGGRLESSNVNLGAQFSDLILIQRGFQASSQIISVSNDMIQQLFGIRGQG